MPQKKKKLKPIKVTYRKLGRERADGLAWKEDRIVEIEERLGGKNLIETIIHEVTHCQNPNWTESMVTKMAKEMTNILWDNGIRWVDLG